jgi:WD40 repeat protein
VCQIYQRIILLRKKNISSYTANKKCYIFAKIFLVFIKIVQYMKTSILKCMMIALLLCSVSVVFGQKRSSIVESINEWKNCKNVLITTTKGNIAVSDKNAYAISGKFPPEMYDIITEASKNQRPVTDMVLTESGKFIVVIGRNGYAAKGIPEKLDARLKEINANDGEIISVSFNDNGDWLLVASGAVYGAISGISNLQSIADKNGRILTGHLTDKGVAIVCENGVYLYGDVPNVLPETIKKTTFRIYRVKFADDGAYFISDKEGSCLFGL